MPASSLVSNPTSTFGLVCRGSLRSTASSVAGFSFAAQPAALAIAVSFGDAVDINIRDATGGKSCAGSLSHSLDSFAFIVKDARRSNRVIRMFREPICVRGANVISSPDALGLLDHIFCARRSSSMARTNSPETALGQATRRVARANFAIPVDDCVSMDRGGRHRVAGMGSWLHARGTGFEYWS